MNLFSIFLYAWTVCLDPGHGGLDPGAVGIYYTEKEANLDVGLWCKHYLQIVNDITSIGMTRTQDVDVSLEDRVNYANSGGFDRFISIHHNSYNTSVQGTETYCYTYGSSQSFDLRDKTHPKLVDAFGYPDRGAKTANYYVLKYTNMPAILGEASFIDYHNGYDESRRFSRQWYDHHAREAYAYTSGLCQHLFLNAPCFVTPTYYPVQVYAGELFTVRDSFYVPEFQSPIDVVFEIKDYSGEILWTKRLENITSGYWIYTFGHPNHPNEELYVPDRGYDYYVYFLTYLVPDGGNWNNRHTYCSSRRDSTLVKTNTGISQMRFLKPSCPFIPYPNPFMKEVRISYGVRRGGPTTIRIYDEVGKGVRTIVDGNFPPGYYTVTWDGKDKSGHSLPNGIYFVIFKTEGLQRMEKLILMR